MGRVSLLASAITTAVGTSFLLGFQRRTNSSYREYDSISNSYIIYILIWLAVPMLGTLPFMVRPANTNPS